MTRPTIDAFFDPTTSTVSYVVHGGPGSDSAVIDPVLEFDIHSGRTGTRPLEPIITLIDTLQLRLQWILETHTHADHVTGAALLKERFGGAHAIGIGVHEVTRHFAPLFAVDPGGFDHLFEDGETFEVGGFRGEVVATPGHTPDGIAYRIGDAVFVGDTLFMPDRGTARCDFAGGDARRLWRSVRRIFSMPPETRLFVCHDYQPAGRPLAFETTVGIQRERNIHIRDGVDEATFAELRESRDRTLAFPGLFIPSVQVNLRAGRLPDFVKIPVDRL
jgi:glyoxylase-like metal-dependent hydrolase (beta-lactamase superfamily II)